MEHLKTHHVLNQDIHLDYIRDAQDRKVLALCHILGFIFLILLILLVTTLSFTVVQNIGEFLDSFTAGEWLCPKSHRLIMSTSLYSFLSLTSCSESGSVAFASW